MILASYQCVFHALSAMSNVTLAALTKQPVCGNEQMKADADYRNLILASYHKSNSTSAVAQMEKKKKRAAE